jgi:hypothetical protein
VYSTPEFCEQVITGNKISNMHVPPWKGLFRGAEYGAAGMLSKLEIELTNTEIRIVTRLSTGIAQELIFKKRFVRARLLRQSPQYILNLELINGGAVAQMDRAAVS